MPTPRTLLLALTFCAGACAGGVAVRASDAVAGSAPSIASATTGPPAQASGLASVVALAEAPVRSNPLGTARIRALAHSAAAWLGQLELDAGAAVPEHVDATDEFIVVLEGGGELTVDGATATIRPGSAVFMPGGARVSYRNGPARLVALQVFAGPGPAAKYGAWR